MTVYMYISWLFFFHILDQSIPTKKSISPKWPLSGYCTKCTIPPKHTCVVTWFWNPGLLGSRRKLASINYVSNLVASHPILKLIWEPTTQQNYPITLRNCEIDDGFSVIVSPLHAIEFRHTSRRLRTALFHLQFCWFEKKRCQSLEFALCLLSFLLFWLQVLRRIQSQTLHNFAWR